MSKRFVRSLTVVLTLTLAGVAPLAAFTQDPPPPPQAPVRVGGLIKEPKRINYVEPVYPAEAKANGIQGMVIIELVIGKDGSVTKGKVLKPVPGLDMAAVDAVRQWKYEVTYLADEPVEVLMIVTVNFTLK